MKDDPKLELRRLRAAAKPLATCTAGWGRTGYGDPEIYTCLDREVDIANPEHETNDWWPRSGPCPNCELARALGRKAKGTLPWAKKVEKMRRDDRRREYDRLRVEFGGAG